MQEKITITISEECLQAIRKQTNAGTRLYEEMLRQKEKIHSLLTGYYFISRRSVSDIGISEDSVIIGSNGRGSFEVTYTLGIFNACADLSFSDTEKMKINIDADPETGETVLTGEYVPEREPDEL